MNPQLQVFRAQLAQLQFNESHMVAQLACMSDLDHAETRLLAFDVAAELNPARQSLLRERADASARLGEAKRAMVAWQLEELRKQIASCREAVKTLSSPIARPMGMQA